MPKGRIEEVRCAMNINRIWNEDQIKVDSYYVICPEKEIDREKQRCDQHVIFGLKIAPVNLRFN